MSTVIWKYWTFRLLSLLLKVVAKVYLQHAHDFLQYFFIFHCLLADINNNSLFYAFPFLGCGCSFPVASPEPALPPTVPGCVMFHPPLFKAMLSLWLSVYPIVCCLPKGPDPWTTSLGRVSLISPFLLNFPSEFMFVHFPSFLKKKK